MNKQFGRLLTMGGFGLLAVISVFHLVNNLFDFLSFIPSSVFSIATILGWTLVAGGFGIIFFAEGNFLDLIIAGGFAVAAILPEVFPGLAYMNIILRITPVSILFLLAGLAWAFKLFSSNQMMAALVGAAAIVPLLANILLRYIFGYSIPLLVNSISLASKAAYLIAAASDT